MKDLRARNEFLKNKISKYEYLEEFESRNVFCSKYHYGELYFKRLPLSYIDTSFYYYANLLYTYVNCTFEHFLLQNTLYELRSNSIESMILSFAMLCIGVKSTNTGPVLILAEPFKTLHTKPLTKTSMELANSWINRVLIVDIKITPTAFNDIEFEVDRIKSLNISEHGRVKDAKEYPFIWGNDILQISDENTFEECKRCDKSSLALFKNSYGKEKCMEALDEIHSIYIKKCLIPPYRQNKNTLWIRFEYEAFGVFYHNNQLEIVYQPKENINTLYNLDGSYKPYKEELENIYDSFFNLETKFKTLDDCIKKAKEEECMVDYRYTCLLKPYYD